MEFSAAKGVLVVDPIEARNIILRRSVSTLYCLFQIDNIVHRSKPTIFKTNRAPGWKEDSQCRFDVDPGFTPVLNVYLMEKTNGLPIVVGKGELNLIEIFYEKRSDRWVKLSPMGQLNLELTFYQVSPFLPAKAPPQVPMKVQPARENKKSEEAKQKISSVDQVFVDENKEERFRLRQLAKKVKRRYKESRSNREAQMKSQLEKMTNDELLFVEVNQNIEKELPEVPSSDSQSDQDSLGSGDKLPDINVLSVDSDTLSQLDFGTLPFSADSIGTHMVAKLDVLKSQQEKQREEEQKFNYTPLSAEAFAIINRLERGSARHKDFQVDAGVSDYKGDGTWGKGRLTDAVFTGERPKLPPKIPYGMVSEEYYMLHRQDYIEYYKTIL